MTDSMRARYTEVGRLTYVLVKPAPQGEFAAHASPKWRFRFPSAG